MQQEIANFCILINSGVKAVEIQNFKIKCGFKHFPQ